MFHEGYKFKNQIENKSISYKDIDYSRAILHCDMNNFYASVELLDFPQYKNMPVAICGDPKNRHGIILAKNQIAKDFGVVTAETIFSAKKKCRNLICLPPNLDKYKKYNKLINEIYLEYTDMIQPFSIDESWLDVTNSQHLFGSGYEIANTLKNRIKNQLGLTLSIGVSFNKIFAKMGSNYKKPDAVTLITKENYKKILWPLDVNKLFFAGKSTTRKLNSIGCYTIGDLAKTHVDVLVNLLGKNGLMLYQYANGLDTSPVSLYHKQDSIKSVSHGITFQRNLIGEKDIRSGIALLSEKVAQRLRNNKCKAMGVKIDIKSADFKVISKQKQFSSPTDVTSDIRNLSFEIIKSCWNFSNPIRLLSIAAINLVDRDSNTQITIEDISNPKNLKMSELDYAIDNIKSKYGNNIIAPGRLIKSPIISE